MNMSLETFNRLDHRSTEKHLNQTDSRLIFTMGKQTLHCVAFIQWHQKSSLYTVFYLESLQDGFCDFLKIAKTSVLLLYLLSKNNFFHRLLASSIMNFSLEGYQKNWKTWLK